MTALVSLIVAYLPKLGVAAQLLTHLPGAIQTGKELKEFIEKVMAILNRPGLLSEEQRGELDKAIDEMTKADHWQPEK